jgi:hypothetical protein
MDTEQLQEIYRLRDRNVSPKQIARSLGLRPADVSAAIRDRATTEALACTSRGELAPLEYCLINATGAQRLLGIGSDPNIEEVDEGMTQIIIARKAGSKLQVCSFLIDYWCLGVKNTLGPRKISTEQFRDFVQKTYIAFGESSIELTIEQAWSIIAGAIAYAKANGFQPHSDFEQAKAILGPQPDRLIPIEYGKDGKPTYVAGPYDNSDRIFQTLTETLGKGKFEFIIMPSF